ncbi:MAG TPA: CsbD family protein [Bdellovibrionota bacterium]|jgi:uncharacterized protein YjbJ (UPF0337 family)|nr:CsbD family protein [Bdellovibrionota bacterium]
MNKEILKGNWQEMKGKIRETWGKLTDDEVDQIEGNYDQLVGRLRQRYGLTVEESQKRVNDFIGGAKSRVNT